MREAASKGTKKDKGKAVEKKVLKQTAPAKATSGKAGESSPKGKKQVDPAVAF